MFTTRHQSIHTLLFLPIILILNLSLSFHLYFFTDNEKCGDLSPREIDSRNTKRNRDSYVVQQQYNELSVSRTHTHTHFIHTIHVTLFLTPPLQNRADRILLLTIFTREGNPTAVRKYDFDTLSKMDPRLSYDEYFRVEYFHLSFFANNVFGSNFFFPRLYHVLQELFNYAFTRNVTGCSK